MPDILKDYFAALERLKRGKPDNAPPGTRITNDSVYDAGERPDISCFKMPPIR